MKYLSKHILLFLSMIAISTSAFSANIEKKSISIIVMRDIKPVSYVNAQGEPDGIFTDLIKKIAELNNFEITYEIDSWSSGLQKVKDGKIDIMPAVIRTNEREQFLDFHKIPVMTSWGIVAVNKDSKISSLLELNNKKIGVMKGDQNAKNLRNIIHKFNIKSQFIEVNNHSEIIPLLENKTIDAGVFFNTFDLCDYDVKTTSIVFNPVQSYFVTAQNTNNELMKAIDKQLEIWVNKKDSYYHEVLHKHFHLHSIERMVIPKWIKALITGIIFISLLLTIWAISLKYVIKLKTQDIENRKKDYERIFNRINDAIFVYKLSEGAPGNFIEVNDIVCRILGYSREELMQLSAKDISRPNRPIEEIIEKLETKRNAIFESILVTKAGDEIPVEINSHLYELNGEYIIQSAVRDISSRKLMEEQLRQSQKMQAIGQLAGGVAHDFNNMLLGIIVYTELALKNSGENNLLKKNLNKILTISDRAKKLVQQILIFSRQGKEEKKIISLEDEINEIYELLKASIPSSTKIIKEIVPNEHTIEANSTKIHEAIMNIATNAVQAMQEKGELKIILKDKVLTHSSQGIIGPIYPGEYSTIEISDNGPGIENRVLQRIFEPFYTTKELGKGTGMGLAVVFGVMQSHNANLQVESIIGQGTTFRLFFPRAKKQIEQQTKTYHSPKEGSEQILLVDDEEMIVEVISELLSDLGYKVTSTSVSKDAIELLKDKNNHYDILITDQTMPEITGLDLSKKALTLRPELPIILLTGYSNIANEKTAQEYGISKFCLKPIKSFELAEAIREVLDKN